MLSVHRPTGSGRVWPDWIGPAPWIAVPPPGPMAMKAVARERRAGPPCRTRPYPLVVSRAQGSIVEDVDGNRFLDFTAGLTVCPIGHGHPQVVAAIEQQTRKLIHICGNDFYHEPMIALSEVLERLAPGAEPHRVLLTGSGEEAIEAALELACHFTNRKRVLAFQTPGGRRIIPASPIEVAPGERSAQGITIEHVQLDSSNDVTAMLGRIQDPGSVAAIICEPLNHERAAVPPDDFLLPLHRYGEQHGSLLIVDEIRSGLGRTGRLFHSEYAGVRADMFLLADGLGGGIPIGAVVASERVLPCLETVLLSTSGGNPVACAAALVILELLQKQYISNSERLHGVAMNKLASIDARQKHLIAPRGRGLMLAVDVVRDGRSREPDPQLRDRIINEAFSRGLLLLGCGQSGIRFTPPLCINSVQLEVGFDVFEEAVATVAH